MTATSLKLIWRISQSMIVTNPRRIYLRLIKRQTNWFLTTRPRTTLSRTKKKKNFCWKYGEKYQDWEKIPCCGQALNESVPDLDLEDDNSSTKKKFCWAYDEKYQDWKKTYCCGVSKDLPVSGLNEKSLNGILTPTKTREDLEILKQESGITLCVDYTDLNRFVQRYVSWDRGYSEQASFVRVKQSRLRAELEAVLGVKIVNTIRPDQAAVCGTKILLIGFSFNAKYDVQIYPDEFVDLGINCYKIMKEKQWGRVNIFLCGEDDAYVLQDKFREPIIKSRKGWGVYSRYPELWIQTHHNNLPTEAKNIVEMSMGELRKWHTDKWDYTCAKVGKNYFVKV